MSFWKTLFCSAMAVAAFSACSDDVTNDGGYEGIPEDCSLVSATYSSNGVKLGTYGVIGPVRMDYKKVVAVLENVGKILESIINKR